ncbi:hypothetical protein L1987_14973 [Smallanthus sonchifolius]|uniref:Uncharacterized protein n=1 Tax=Smallanthus sonchifolius TaxID=185202 RepID=A0ACB9J4T6_9ASTR|nr:hypothetical protein L1987_14973 [Smallanthus sonchifolius]
MNRRGIQQLVFGDSKKVLGEYTEAVEVLLSTGVLLAVFLDERREPVLRRSSEEVVVGMVSDLGNERIVRSCMDGVNSAGALIKHDRAWLT